MKRVYWLCTLLSLFLIFTSTAEAKNALGINKQLGITSQQNDKTASPDSMQHSIEQSIAQLEEQANHFSQIQANFEQQKSELEKQIVDANKGVSIEQDQDLNQQASLANFDLTDLKQQESDLSQQITELLDKRNELPNEILNAKSNLNQHKKTILAPIGTPTGQLQQKRRELYLQSIDTLETDFASLPVRLTLTQLELQIVRIKLTNQEKLIEALNQKLSQQRQQKTAETIAKAINVKTDINDPIAEQLNAQNQSFASSLVILTDKINQTVKQQEKAENLYQLQSKQLANIKEQLSWVTLNSTFGEHFLKTLESLPKPPNITKLQTRLSDNRLKRYTLSQKQAQNKDRLAASLALTLPQRELLEAQISLTTKLLLEYDQYLSELNRLKVSYNQLIAQHQELASILNEQLFWVPNANTIGKQWFIDIGLSFQWLLTQAPWNDLKYSWEEQQSYWLLWMLILTLCTVSQDLNRSRFRRVLRANMDHVGNVTQDTFSATFKTLLTTIGYSLLKPTSVILAGVLMLHSERNIVYATGGALFGIGLFYLLQRLVYVFTLPEGLLVGHFKRPQDMVARGYQYIKRFYYINIILIGTLAFTQLIDESLLRNSLGRGAFILICLQLFFLVRHLNRLMEDYKQQSNKTNARLLQKMLWGALSVAPIAATILSFMGYYFSAYQMMQQLVLSVVIALGFLMLYQLIKRWMLIERRRIAFDRAKNKRAEMLAQREKGETVNQTENSEFYEEPEVDLETISSQSLGLVRSLLLLGLLASLIGLWTQTHTALFSFFDGITLWSSTATVNGIEQQIPITIKSLLYGIIIFGFSMMIATNLPGLLELTILQRLELSSGTGYAITTVTRYLVLFIGSLIGFNTLGVEWSKLQWLIAALSVGLGFGLQEIFANFISGLIILFEKPVRIGDTVTIRELTGTVSKIKIRATTIIDWDRKEIIVPNKAFITEQLVNWSLSDPITRVTIQVAVARDSDPAKVEAALYQAVEECQHTLKTPEPEVWFAGFGKHTQDYEIRAYATDMTTRWPLRHELHKKITKKLKDNHLELAYPQMEIHLNTGIPKESSLAQGMIKS
ncbi:mechanosensitive ion channel protein MscS [Shewanella sp. OPT22]|nr:mechanosensitive ion channel protein MscS [Shewanella sp. OPT22]